jgi:DnaK suppressor protein
MSEVKSVAAKSKGKSTAKVAVKAKSAVARPAAKAAPKTRAKAAAPVKKPTAKTPVKAVKAVKGKSAAVKKTPVKKTPLKSAPKAKAVAPVKTPVKAKAPVPVKAKVPAAKTTAAQKPAAKAAAVVPRPAAPKALPMPISAAPPTPVAVRKNPRLANNWKTKPIEQWSDAEVIAMPDSEYMNDPQMAFFRLRLVGLKNGILANADQTAENLRDDTVVVPDPADRATIEEEHALELRTRDRERKLLKKIEQSIARIDTGDYGYCDETGEPIGVPRLLARPTATLSLEAQQRRELKQKMFGD